MDSERIVSDIEWRTLDLRDLCLSEETYSRLYYWGCKTIGCLANMTVKQIQRIPGMDNASCAEIIRNLAMAEIILESEDSEYPSQSRENIKKHPYPTNLFIAMNEIVPCINLADTYDDDVMLGLSTALSALPEKEEAMIILRYKYCESFAIIGRDFDITHEAARQCIKRTVQKLMRPPYRCMIEHGLKGYIDTLAEERAKELVQAYLHDEYSRGYSAGYEAKRKDDWKAQFENANPKILQMPIADLNLTLRTYNCLRRVGIETVSDLLQYDPQKILLIRNMSMKCVDELDRRLSELGFPYSQWKRNLWKSQPE